MPVASLASDQNKLTRRASLDGFRQGKICELLTTDVAARGLDVDQLGYVVNTEVPQEKESYLHRAGRVGRMGNEGTVITIVQDHTLKDLKKIAAQLDLRCKKFSCMEVRFTQSVRKLKVNLKKSRVCRKITEKLLKNYTLCQRKRRKSKKTKKIKAKDAIERLFVLPLTVVNY